MPCSFFVTNPFLPSSVSFLHTMVSFLSFNALILLFYSPFLPSAAQFLPWHHSCLILPCSCFVPALYWPIPAFQAHFCHILNRPLFCSPYFPPSNDHSCLHKCICLSLTIPFLSTTHSCLWTIFANIHSCFNFNFSVSYLLFPAFHCFIPAFYIYCFSMPS